MTDADGSTAVAAGDRAAVDSPTDGAAGTSPDAPDRSLAPYLGLAVCYLVTVLGGLALAPEAAARGLILFENPDSVGNVGIFAAIVLGFTVVFVAAVRYDRGMELVRLFLLAAFGSLVAAAAALGAGLGDVFVANPLLAGLPSSPVSAAIAVGTAVALWAYPEWYVIDVVAVVAGAAAIAMLGLSFGPLPIVVLLVLWAAYDAYAVYVSGHMKDVAAGAGSLKLPMVYVVPTRRDYSLREAGLDLGLDEADADTASAVETDGDETAGAVETDGGASGNARGLEPAGGNEATPSDDRGADVGAAEGGDADPTAGRSGRPAMILGLGDALIPGMLAVSAGHYLEAPTIVAPLALNGPALGALAGGVVGLAALVVVLHRFDGAHAGLPPLNAGVLGGYLVGAVAAGVPLSAALGL